MWLFACPPSMAAGVPSASVTRAGGTALQDLMTARVRPAHTRRVGGSEPTPGGRRTWEHPHTLPCLTNAHVLDGHPRPWGLRWQRAAAGF